ncbi:hypothetical protein CC78DRAFT_613012 [Lojkania enalia]|uniref:Uncharacterized protein n=1 Tax=Lojkania enalia TaxID=147567 RepID=A0A9P4N8D0_9PLEO|nr:hypothetical protein CC78DRAFT_613012 [Didymosphaeria enalia]
MQSICQIKGRLLSRLGLVMILPRARPGVHRWPPAAGPTCLSTSRWARYWFRSKLQDKFRVATKDAGKVATTDSRPTASKHLPSSSQRNSPLMGSTRYLSRFGDMIGGRHLIILMTRAGRDGCEVEKVGPEPYGRALNDRGRGRKASKIVKLCDAIPKPHPYSPLTTAHPPLCLTTNALLLFCILFLFLSGHLNLPPITASPAGSLAATTSPLTPDAAQSAALRFPGSPRPSPQCRRSAASELPPVSPAAACALMPMWPFGRRGAKAAKIKDSDRPTAATAVAEGKRPVAGGSRDPASSDALRSKPQRRSSRRKRRTSRSPTASMRDLDATSPILPPVVPFAHNHALLDTSAEDITALPLSKRLQHSPHLRPVTLQDHHIAYNFQSTSHSSLPSARERGKLQRPQSLRKRSANETGVVRRKSSKKRKNDHVREEEIRAMSMPLPQKRPAGNSGGMLRRDSKKVKGGFNKHFERPTSNISLPLQDSIHSSMSGSSETRAFRVSALDMFSPRPKIRYSVGSQYYYAAGPSPTSQKDRITPASQDGKEEKRSKRIDDLADTLDAGALRDILERDKRRQEKKRKAEEERLRRRLERRAEKQRATTENGGTLATPRREAKGAIGLGIGRETATPMEDVRPATTPPPPPPQALETTELAPKVEENSQLPTPLESPIEEPVVADAQAVRYSRASMSSPVSPLHARGASNVSQLPDLVSEVAAREKPIRSVETLPDPNASGSLHPVQTTDTTSTSKKETGRRRSSESRRLNVFASLFRRGKRNSQDQRARATSSEVSFSNTSRESMSRHPPPAHLVGPPSQPIDIRRPSSVPRRTMSKFREDLPEFPISPPDSRVQSPEGASSSVAASRHRSQPAYTAESTSSDPGRTDSPVSPGVPPVGLMSQSLASVDSEGSWLSGKPMKRRSNKSHFRSSVGSSTTARRQEEFNASYEELGIPDDEYFKRLTPQPDEHRISIQSGEMMVRKPSSTAMAIIDAAAQSDDEARPAMERRPSDEENLVQSSVGRQPTIVHRQPRVKSTEGLLSYFQGDVPSPEEHPHINAEGPTEKESPDSDVGPVQVQRARSVDLGKHHGRHLSAGSAKLLEIPAKRSSVDQKRSSTGSQNRLSE